MYFLFILIGINLINDTNLAMQNKLIFQNRKKFFVAKKYFFITYMHQKKSPVHLKDYTLTQTLLLKSSNSFGKL